MNPPKNEVVIATPRVVHNSAAESDLDEERSVSSNPRRKSFPSSISHDVKPVLRRISIGEPSSTHRATSPPKSPVKPRSIDLSYGSRGKPKPVTRAWITPIRRESPASSVEEAPRPIVHPQRVMSSYIRPLPLQHQSTPSNGSRREEIAVSDDKLPQPLRQERRQEKVVLAQHHVSYERDGNSKISREGGWENNDRQHSNRSPPLHPTSTPPLAIPTRNDMQGVRQRQSSNDDIVRRHRKGVRELREAYFAMKNKKE